MARDEHPRPSRRGPLPPARQARAGAGQEARGASSLGGSVLGLLLIGVVAYAVPNQGAGFEDPLEKADKQLEGVAVAGQGSLSRNHVDGAGDYPQTPAERRRPQRHPADLPGLRRSRSRRARRALPGARRRLDHLPAGPAGRPGRDAAGAGRGRPVRADEPVPGPEGPDRPVRLGPSPVGRQAPPTRGSRSSSTAYTNGPQTPEKGATCAGDTTTGPLRPRPPRRRPAWPPGPAG